VRFRASHDIARGASAALTAASLALLILACSGCAAIKATQQPEKKNLKVLSLGTPRSHVIAEIGAPIYTEDRDGVKVDVFAFKQGYTKLTKAGRALVHGAADVATGGLWEVVGIPAESLADGKDVKVEVTYDDRRAVRSIDVIQGQEQITPRPLFGRKPKPAATIATQTDAVPKPS
jgi:outer membrane protein assembly factor BamE (lipoprotein component of BamABCDE complex)